jgi:hypothetical protein
MSHPHRSFALAVPFVPPHSQLPAAACRASAPAAGPAKRPAKRPAERSGKRPASAPAALPAFGRSISAVRRMTAWMLPQATKLAVERMTPWAAFVAVTALAFMGSNTFRLAAVVGAEPLEAGVARVDITNPQAARVNDPSYAKVLVLRQGTMSAVLVTVDAVAIGGIGAIPGTFMDAVRGELAVEPGIPADNIVVNASHCHGSVRADSDKLVVAAVRAAWKKLAPVKVGSGATTEKRISENRRVTLKDGSQVDMRRAYSFAWDAEIASIGPIDPQVGLLRIDRLDGRPLAVVYNFACHPIMNPPSKGTSADFPAYASKVIESAMGPDALAFFVQGCGGDINPVRYKEVRTPPDAEPLGLMLGTTVLEAVRRIEPAPHGPLAVKTLRLAVPRAADFPQRIAAIEAERTRLVDSLKSTNINFKTFLPLLIQQRISPEFPSAYAQGYMHDKAIERDDLERLDAESRQQVENYLLNIQVMERLTRLNTNLALLKMHQKKAQAAAVDAIDVELCGLRIGDFKLATFPGELTVQIGLNIKRAANDAGAFVAGYTNGYIFYLPTVEQRRNTGYAQEDCDCQVAPEWQRVFETNAAEMFKALGGQAR